MKISQRLLALHQFLVPPGSGQGWTAYLWLVYLGFFFLEWFFRPVSAIELGLGLASVAVFLALYFSIFRREGLAALWHIIAIVALAVVWSFFNVGASVLFIYAGASAFLVGRPPLSVWVLFGIAVSAAATAWLAQPTPMHWLPGVGISLIIGAANIFAGEKERHNAELRLSQTEVRRLARIAERERIARDLHDVLGHALSMIAVKSELAERLVERDPDQARAEIRSMGDSARQSLTEVREAISNYRQQSIADALEHSRLSLQVAAISARIDGLPDAALAVLPERTQSMLALVLREAVTNIIRHSNARHCHIRLTSRGDTLELFVDDDGGGQIRMDGNGIQGMRARIESLGGSLEIGATSPSSLTARVPGSAT